MLETAVVDCTRFTIAGGLAVLAGFGGAYEAALLSVSRSRLEELLEEPSSESTQPVSAFLRAIIEGKEIIRLSVALLHALALCGFLFYSWYTWVMAPLQRSLSDASLNVLLIFVAAAMVRAIAVLAGGVEEESLILNGARCAWGLTLPLRPFAWVIQKAAKIIARSLGWKMEMSQEELLEEREEEVIAAVSDGELDGVVAEEQREMIEGIFDLKDSDAADVFRPRTDMVSVSVESDIGEAIAIALDAGYSRLPVHEGTRDNIVGIFYARDALPYWGKKTGEIPALRQILRQPLFVPETKEVPELLREMREEQTHMAIVLDEYGGTAGLVTIEDVLEEIVGEIHDEYDSEKTEAPIRVIDENTIIAEGSTHVHDVNEVFDTDSIPEDDDYETLGGFVLDNLGHIPEKGETFAHKAFRLEVLDADERKVNRVRVIRDASAEEE